jgi:hypothetical protein
MSTTQAQATATTEDSAARYAPHNWYGDDDDQEASYDDPEDNPERNPGVGGTWRPDPNDPAEIVAHQILRETGTLLCATQLYEPPWNGGRTAELFAWLFEDELIDGGEGALHRENRPVELSDPSIKLPKQTPGDRPDTGCERYRRRVNPETGYINGGESTAIVIQRRPCDEFMAVVDEYLGLQPLFDREIEDLRQYARRLKGQQHHNGMSDKDILSRVISECRDFREQPS